MDRGGARQRQHEGGERRDRASVIGLALVIGNDYLKVSDCATTTRAAEEFTRLIEIMADAARGPDGCPWDREQTIDSLKPFVLEETYEVLEAIDRHDHAALCEELGDFVFEAVFLAQLEAEAGHFTIADSLKSVADKLVRRHPHVFARETGRSGARHRRPGADAVGGDQGARSDAADGSRRRRRRLLERHRADAAGAAARVPHRHARRVGRLRLDAAPAMSSAKIQEEVDELREVVDDAGATSIGRAPRKKWATCSSRSPTCRASSASSPRRRCGRPTTSSRAASRTMERAIAASGRAMKEMTLDELEEEWQTSRSALLAARGQHKAELEATKARLSC